MLIYYLVTSLESGGAELMIPDITTAIRDAGHHAHVFACEPRDRVAEARLVQAEVPYTLLSHIKASKLGSIFRFARAVRRTRPDVIWTSLSHATLVGQIVGALFGIPVASWKHSAKAKTYIRRTQSLSSLWIADSVNVADHLKDDMGVDPQHIVTWPLFNPVATGAAVPTWNGFGRLRIGSAGRLQPQKNYDLLILAVARLREIDPSTFEQLNVTIAGDGPLRPHLQNLIDSLSLRGTIRLLGWVDDISDYLRQLHLYVQPSAYEGMCIAAHEAMAVGLPVIVTPVGELRRSVEIGEAGILIEGDIVDGLVIGVQKLIRHPELMKVYGRNAEAYVMKAMSNRAFSQAARMSIARVEALAIA